MKLSAKPIPSIEQADLLELISNQESEGKTLEFKSEIPGGTDDEKKEFLADVSSFANAVGGFIIYGMKEAQGIASSLDGIDELDPDKEKQRIENILRDGIAPRIIGIAIHPVNLDNGNYAIVIHVPKSLASPHMVTHKGTSRFFTRNSSGKYQMDVHEIRQAFLASESVTQKIRDFRLDRLSQIGTLETPVPLAEGAKIILHSIPLTAFESVMPVDISSKPNDIYRLLPNANAFRFNLDGIVSYLNINQNTTAMYSQLFRNGIVEIVDDYLLKANSDGKQIIPSVSFERQIIESCERILRFQQHLGIEPPIFLFLTLLHVKGYRMGVSERVMLWALGRQYDRVIDRNAILAPEVTVENYSVTDSLHVQLKPVFDVCWNACGWPRSMSYDENGKWISR